MNNHAEKAKELFEQGYNCAQAVFAAFSDVTGLDMETSLKLSSSFGGGLGRLREVCGAVSGMAMAAGMLYGNTQPNNDAAKAAHYQLIQDLAGRFRAKHETIICRELLHLDGAGNPIPDPRTKQYYETRPCAGLVYDAAQILDEYIQGEETKK